MVILSKAYQRINTINIEEEFGGNRSLITISKFWFRLGYNKKLNTISRQMLTATNLC